MYRRDQQKPLGRTELSHGWEKGIEFVLKIEGGLVNNPADPGGLTKYGISQAAYPDLDIANLTVEQASAIYKKEYWDTCKCDEMPTPIAIAVFDTAVNMGVKTSVMLLQRSLGVKVDSILGNITLKEAKKAGKTILNRFIVYRIKKYIDIIENNQKMKEFEFGWLYRVVLLCDLVLEDTIWA